MFGVVFNTTRLGSCVIVILTSAVKWLCLDGNLENCVTSDVAKFC